MNRFENILTGGDLRSIGNANEIVTLIHNQDEFDDLIPCLNHTDRKVVMRAADAIEKITTVKPDYLQKHKKDILQRSQQATDIELKWHLALLVSRLQLKKNERRQAWDLLSKWAMDIAESKIVRVNAIQGLFNLLKQNGERSNEFLDTIKSIEKENIPSLNARIRKLLNKPDLQIQSNCMFRAMSIGDMKINTKQDQSNV